VVWFESRQYFPLPLCYTKSNQKFIYPSNHAAVNKQHLRSLISSAVLYQTRLNIQPQALPPRSVYTIDHSHDTAPPFHLSYDLWAFAHVSLNGGVCALSSPTGTGFQPEHPRQSGHALCTLQQAECFFSRLVEEVVVRA
jgi:hypothetical protein